MSCSLVQLKEQLLSSQDEGKGCLLEAAATAGWFTRGPQMPLSTLELIDSAWDDFERSLDSRRNITGAFTAKGLL